jgi:hypothetical protein
LLQTLQCTALITCNAHPAQIPHRVGSASFPAAQLPTALSRIKASSLPALDAVYASGMFAKERQSFPPQTTCAARSTLVVMPASILHQWEKELKDWAPFLDVFVFQGSHVHKHYELLMCRLLTCDVVLISCACIAHARSKSNAHNAATPRFSHKQHNLAHTLLQGTRWRKSTGARGTRRSCETIARALISPPPFCRFISGASSWTRRSTKALARVPM